MAYNANGKTYTDNPLLDEIAYNCKKILQGIVIKNDVLGNKSETENSLDNAELYYIQHEDGIIPFSIFPFTVEILRGFGYTDPEAINSYILDRNNIPVSDRTALTAYANKYFAEHFEEENNYYRMLNGLPPFNSGEDYFIYLKKGDFPAKYKKNIDYRVPLHLQPKDILSILYNTGKIDELRKTYSSSNYSYINFLGPRKIDLYTARRASKWDILYMPNVYYLVEDKFTDCYKINRDLYMNQSYQESYSDTGDYYDQLMIITLLAQTFADMVTDTPEWYIRRDVFDIRSVKYFLESYGVEFFREIPLKYQVRIVKNLNKLIKFKSSNMNLEDIVELITTEENVKILKYWLYKNRLTDRKGNYKEGDTEEDKYALEFINSPVYDSYDNYIKDNIYRNQYDDLTYADKYWDGQDTHSYIRSTILNKDFTVEGTKYMSIEYRVSLSEYLFEIEYFLSLVLDSKIDLEDVRISIPTIDENVDFSLTNIFLYLVILSDCYYRQNYEDRALDIRRPDAEVGGDIRIDENYYDWKKKYLHEIYTVKTHRVHAFNVNFNRAAMEDFITNGNNRRHSHYIFGNSYDNVDFDNPGKDKPLNAKQYKERASAALDELGINEFRVPAAKYDTVQELVDLYRHNRRCYEILMDKIRWCDDEDELATLAYIYQEMYTREFDENFYKLSDGTPAKNLADILLERDYILWQSHMEIMQERNIEARKDLIRDVLNDVVSTLEYYMSGDGLEYLFSFTPINSFFNIVYYIWLLIGFFKSYKVSFLDPFATFVVDNKMDPLDATMWTMDEINEMNFTRWKEDKAFTADHSLINPNYGFKDDASIQIDATDLYAYQERNPFEDTDYDGIHAEDGEAEGYKELDGGIADDISNAPYIDADAGHSYLGRTDMDDINGGEADEKYHDYSEIDGGGAYHDEDEIKNWRGSQLFNYDIDGGTSSRVYFKSKSVEVDLKANLIRLHVITSQRDGNKVQVLEDGVYVPDFMVDQSEMNAVLAEYDSLRNMITIGAEDLFTDIMSIGSWDDVRKLLARDINTYLYDITFSLDEILNGKLLQRIKIFADMEYLYLLSVFSNMPNPYGWDELIVREA